ncbi:hypothetical protein [Methanobrevibacter sp.]
MEREDVLNSLQKKNNSLKSKLLKTQLKYGNFSLQYYEKYSGLVLEEYRHEKSLFKSALKFNIDPKEVLNWYSQGQLGNPRFQKFYREINKINSISSQNTQIPENAKTSKPETMDGEYMISQYGDGWSYKTFVDGEKIFIISDELESLKQKVKSRHLPLD